MEVKIDEELLEFLINLALDAGTKKAFAEDPEQAMRDARLSDDAKVVIRSGIFADIRNEVVNVQSTGGFLVAQIKKAAAEVAAGKPKK
jgi:hypothetical protein